MATFTAIKNKKQTAGVLGGVLKYVQQEKKTRAGGGSFTCTPSGTILYPPCFTTEWTNRR